MNAVVLEGKEKNEEQASSKIGFYRVLVPTANYAALILCWCVAGGVIYMIWLQHGNFSVRRPDG